MDEFSEEVLRSERGVDVVPTGEESMTTDLATRVAEALCLPDDDSLAPLLADTWAEVADLRARVAEFERLQQVWLMSPEAASRLDGYRELAAKCASLEATDDDLRAQLAAAQAESRKHLAWAQEHLDRATERNVSLAEARTIIEDLLAAVYAWSDGRGGRYPAKEAAEAWLATRGGKR